MDQRNLELLLKSHFPIIVMETAEELRALDLVKRAAMRHRAQLLQWSVASGLRSALDGPARAGELRLGGFGAAGSEPAASTNHDDPEAMLEHLNAGVSDSTVVLLDFHPYLENPRVLRLLKEFALASHRNRSTLVLISHALTPPAEIQRLCARFELTLPDSDKLRQMIEDEVKVWQLKHADSHLKVDRQALELLTRNLLGLTHTDARRLIRNAIYDDGAITHSDLDEVQEAKYRLIDPNGILSFEYDTAQMKEVGGLARFKQWLELRRAPFLADGDDVDPDVPKGVLLLGVQGGGKSLAAKAVAGHWGVPLLRLDFGALYNKYIGETERNVRDTLRAAELLAPCVLWVDEIEKGIDGGDGETGTARRVLGTLLSWMAERRARVFLVATANDVSALPPELIRKGRMDEIFFVDLPDETARQQILHIHLRKRGLDPYAFDLAPLVAASDGYSGAELEQAVVGARFAAQAAQEPLNDSHLLDALGSTRPLSVVMAEPVAQLRAWARERAVSAQ